MTGYGWLIYGAGGHGRVVREILRAAGVTAGRIVFVDDAAKRSHVDGCRVLRSLPRPTPEQVGTVQVIVAVGDNVRRWELTNLAEAGGWTLGTAVHPSAVVARTARIGPGTSVCARACVGPGARIDAGCILNTGCDVDHDCRIGHHTHVAPGAVLCGNVTVGCGCLIGAGAILLPGSTVGPHAVVGAGALIREDQVVPANATMVGVPSRCLCKEQDTGAVAWGRTLCFG